MEKLIKSLQAASEGLTPDVLNAFCKDAEESARKFREAKRLFFEDLYARQSGISKSTGAHEERLAEIRARKEQLTEDLADAYTYGETDRAHQIEKDLEDLAREEYGVAEASKHVQTVKVRGDLDLFADLLSAYREYKEYIDSMYKSLSTLINQLQTVAEHLERYGEEVRGRRSAYNNYTYNGTTDTVVEAAESIIGKIELGEDRTGFTDAHGDTRAKTIIIDGMTPSSPGYEVLSKSPGYAKWCKLLAKLDDID